MSNTHNRRVLRVTGKDARDFLQGLITNDINKVENGLVYSAILTPQGKYLADFFILKAGDALLLDTDANQSDALAKRLNMYRLRADVTIEDDARNVTRGLGTPPNGAFEDPRDSALGWRGYEGQTGDDTVDWTALEVQQLIPSAGHELTSESYILEMGFERLNGVDFKKGCYVGQEVTARMKHKTALKKGLAQVQIAGFAPVGTQITREDGKPAGTLFRQTPTHALAYLRFDRAKGPLNAKDAQITYAP